MHVEGQRRALGRKEGCYELLARRMENLCILEGIQIPEYGFFAGSKWFQFVSPIILVDRRARSRRVDRITELE